MSKEGIKIIMKLLNLSLDSPISIFEIKNFPDLMTFLDEENKSQLSLKIIENLVNDYNIGVIDSKDKMLSVLELVRPLIEDNPNSSEEIKDNYQIEIEQAILSKVIYIPCSQDPFEQYEIYCILKNTFLSSNNQNKLKYSLPTLVNSLINLIMGVSEAYGAINSQEEGEKGNEKDLKEKTDKKEKKNKIKKDFESKYSLEKFDKNNLDSYLDFFKKVYGTIGEILSMLVDINPELTCKLYLATITQFNLLKIKLDNLSEIYQNFIDEAIKILKDKITQSKQFEILTIAMGTLEQIKLIPEEKLLEICKTLMQISQGLFKRSDQCVAMINCSKLFYGKILKNKEMALECLGKAKKYADYAMTTPSNCILFVYIINQYVYLDLNIEDFDKLAKPDLINDLIEYVNNYLDTMKKELQNQDAAKIEVYFKNTLAFIKNKKDKKLGKILANVNA